MKTNKLLGIGSIVAGGLLLVLPQTVLKSCAMGMKCGDSVKAVSAIAVLIIVLGAGSLVVSQLQGQYVLHLLGLVMAAETFLIPYGWIGGCEKKMMACQMKTFPGFYAVSLLYAFLIIISFFLVKGSTKREEQ